MGLHKPIRLFLLRVCLTQKEVGSVHHGEAAGTSAIHGYPILAILGHQPIHRPSSFLGVDHLITCTDYLARTAYSSEGRRRNNIHFSRTPWLPKSVSCKSRRRDRRLTWPRCLRLMSRTFEGAENAVEYSNPIA